MKQKDTLSDWVAWTIYSFIIALGIHPLRRWIFAEAYEKMTWQQEVLLFFIIMIAVLFILVRPVAHTLREEDKKPRK